jgi:hypothetical protein
MIVETDLNIVICIEQCMINITPNEDRSKNIIEMKPYIDGDLTDFYAFFGTSYNENGNAFIVNTRNYDKVLKKYLQRKNKYKDAIKSNDENNTIIIRKNNNKS